MSARGGAISRLWQFRMERMDRPSFSSDLFRGHLLSVLFPLLLRWRGLQVVNVTIPTPLRQNLA